MRRRKRRSAAKSHSVSTPKPRPLVSSKRSSFTSTVLDVIGIRAFKRDAPLSQPDRRRLVTDVIIAIVLFFITLCTRFHKLEHPAKIVFDEFHFAAFIHNYMRGEYLFDIHPPFAKLTLTAIAKLTSYDPIPFKFDQLGKPYGQISYYPQRAFSAALGSLIPSVLYLTSRALSLSTAVAVMTGAMALFDMLLCVESRLILTDAQLILYVQLSLLFAVLMWKTPKSTPRRYLFVVLTAVFGAFAVATKWTAIVAPGIIAIVSLTGIVFPKAPLDVLEMILAAVIAISIYMASFWIHFYLLPNSGPGDAFMAMDFRRTLNGSEFFDATQKAPSFLAKFRYLNWEMFRANRDITARHPWESKWYEWLYNARGILYIDETTGEGLKEQIYLLMNPVLCVVTLGGVISSVLMIVLSPWRISRLRKAGDEQSAVKADKLRQSSLQMGVFLVGWVMNLVPYVGVKRCTFVYHVLPALQMSCVLTALSVQQLPARARTAACTLIICALAGSFFYFRAWTYGLARSREQLDALRWMKRWN
ncbi:unnamed protein product [Agarophyton chilense]